MPFAEEQNPITRRAATELVQQLRRLTEHGAPDDVLVNAAQMALLAESSRMAAAAIVHARETMPQPHRATELREAANDILAAWDKGTGLLTSCYSQTGRKLIERLRVACE